MSTAWQQAVRPEIVRELLRPLLLARDVERGWLGVLLGRAAWPELLYPMLAAWNEQWSGSEDGSHGALPIVHARPPVHATTLETHVHHAAVVPRKTTTAPSLVAPPRVQARRASETSAPTTPAKRDAPAGDRLVLETRTITEAPPADRDPEPRRPPERPLPRVVAAFRKDLSESAGRAPARREPAAAPAPAPPAASQPHTSAAPTRPTVEPRSPTPPPAARLQPVPGDMPPRVHPSAPAVTPSQGPVPGDIPLLHPPAAVAPSQQPVPGDIPLVHPTAPAVTPSQQPVPGDIPLVHARAPDLLASPTPARRIAAPTDPSISTPTPHPRVTARQPATPVPARTGARTAPPVPARWAEPSVTPPPRAPARSPLTSDLSHPRPVIPQPPQERPRLASTPTPQPAPSVSPTPASQPPAPPPLDVESLIKTVEQRLAREFARARDLRRALR
ncbi:MAG TPA: hypothetical protein VGB85_29840 [Nannocystis sp.]